MFHHQCVQLDYIEMDMKLLMDTANDHGRNLKSVCNVLLDGTGWLKLDLILDVYVNVESVRVLCRSKLTLDVEAYGKMVTILKGLDIDEEVPRKLNRIEFVQPNEEGILLEDAVDIFKKDVEIRRKWKVEHKTIHEYRSFIIRRRKGGDSDDCLVM